MQIPNLRRLNKGDFEQKDQALMERLSYLFNIDLETLYNALSNRLTFNDNFNANIKDLQVSVDSNGIPTVDTFISTKISGQVTGMIVLSAINQVNSNIYPTSMPFISFSNTATGNLKINHISGLQTGTNYLLTILALGS